jgi:hypothetical protein
MFILPKDLKENINKPQAANICKEALDRVGDDDELEDEDMD